MKFKLILFSLLISQITICQQTIDDSLFHDGIQREFTIETSPLLEKLKEAKRKDEVEEDIIKYLRLKKLYVDYIIPATIV